ncbi:MAG: SPOR domain-containing protein [Gammaproteobacteria bacterium]
MLDYKDVPRGYEPRSRGRWRGPLLIVLALGVLIGGLSFLAVDTLNVRENIEQDRREKAQQTKQDETDTHVEETEASSLADTKADVVQDEPVPSEAKVEPVVEEKSPAQADGQRRIPVPVKPIPPKKREKSPSAKEDQEKGSESESEAPKSEQQGSSDPNKKEPENKAKDGESDEDKQAQDVAEAEPSEPHYDFYTLLPEYEVVIPEEELRPAKAAVEPAKLEPIKVEADAIYLLQVGSFRTEAQAEDSRARLALLGFEASIHESSADGKQWFRVRLGPYRQAAELNDVRALLAAEGFGVLALRARRP